ncbi:hypothetical protein CBL_01002 [Carabus blaptoides fortunei]
MFDSTIDGMRSVVFISGNGGGAYMICMKSLQVFILLAVTLVAVVLVCPCDGAASPFLYSLYPVAPQNSRRSRPQKPYRERSGRGRYNEICRLHAGDSIAFPGRIGNPVCPW